MQLDFFVIKLLQLATFSFDPKTEFNFYSF